MKYLVLERKTVTVDEVLAAAEKAGLLKELATAANARVNPNGFRRVVRALREGRKR